MGLSSREIICENCGRIMRKTVSGVKVRCESMEGVQRGDRYECRGCGAKILTDWSGESEFGKHTEDIYYERLRS